MTDDYKLTIQDNDLVCIFEAQVQWSIRIDSIKFIGEYTTSAGPLAEDWFFVFANKKDKWWQASSLAIDHECFWRDLGSKLNCSISPNLFHFTSWKTRVMYPKDLEGQELFSVVEVINTRPKTFWQKLFKTADLEETLELTKDVAQLFEEKKPNQ